MPEKLYQSHSLEITNEGISGSLTLWEDSPVSPFDIGDSFQPVEDCPMLTVEKVSIKDNIVGELFGKPVRQWEVTVEGSNNSSSDGQTFVKYNFTISENIKSGTMEVTNTGKAPVFSLSVGDTFSVPGIGNVTCIEITGNDEYLNDGTRRWVVIYSWTDGNSESDTRYNFSIEKNGDDNTITTGSKTVLNKGNAPSNVEFLDTLNIPGVGDLPCVKVSGSDDYDDDGNHVWTVTHEGSDAPEQSQTEHDTKYNFTIERNGETAITTGSKVVTNTGNAPENVTLSDTLNVPGIGDLPCVKVSGSDDYDDDGNHVWTVTHEGSNAPEQSQSEHDTKYNFTIERNGETAITTGSKVVTNTGNAPENVTLSDTLNVPGIGDLPCVKVSGSDDYDDDGNHVWTVTHEGSNAPEQSQIEHDTKYNFTIERNDNDEIIKTGSKTVIDKQNNPSLTVDVGDTLNVPGIGDVTCVKVSGSDDYDDNGSRQWTIVYEGNDDTSNTKPEILYRINIEKNSEGVTVYTGTKEFTYEGENPSVSEKVGDTLTFPIIGNVTCSRISSSNIAPNTWSIIIEGTRYGDGSGTGGEDQTDTSLPEREEYSTYDINGNTVRTVDGELLILRRSSDPILKKNIIIYDNNSSNISTLGGSYDDGIAISENITKETIKENGTVVKSYYKHTIEVES